MALHGRTATVNKVHIKLVINELPLAAGPACAFIFLVMSVPSNVAQRILYVSAEDKKVGYAHQIYFVKIPSSPAWLDPDSCHIPTVQYQGNF